MTKVFNLLKFFVATPSDVVEERNCIEEVVSKINSSFQDIFGIQIVLEMGEQGVVSDDGRDGQEVIRHQVSKDYDIFIGLMRSTVGTTTKRATRWVSEETERALEKYRKNPASLQIQLYFKESPPSLNAPGNEEFATVDSFKNYLHEKGVLFFQYDNLATFKSAVYAHVMFQMLGHSKSWGDGIHQNEVASQGGHLANNSQGEGKSLETLFKEPLTNDFVIELNAYIEKFNQEFGQFSNNQSNQPIANLQNAKEALDKKILSKTQELARIADSGKSKVAKDLERLRVCKVINNDLGEFAKALAEYEKYFAQEFPDFLGKFLRLANVLSFYKGLGFTLFDTLIESAGEYAHTQVSILNDSLLGAKNAFSNSHKVMVDWVAAIPYLAEGGNKAIRIYEQLNTDYSKVIALAESLVQMLADLSKKRE